MSYVPGVFSWPPPLASIAILKFGQNLTRKILFHEGIEFDCAQSSEPNFSRVRSRTSKFTSPWSVFLTPLLPPPPFKQKVSSKFLLEDMLMIQKSTRKGEHYQPLSTLNNPCNFAVSPLLIIESAMHNILHLKGVEVCEHLEFYYRTNIGNKVINY